MSEEGKKMVKEFATTEDLVLKEMSLDDALERFNCKALYELGQKVNLLGNRAFLCEEGVCKVIIIL